MSTPNFTHDGQLWQIVTRTATKLVAVPAASKADLVAERARLGLNTRDMATRLGISQSKLVKLENGTQWKSLPTVLEAARKLSK